MGTFIWGMNPINNQSSIDQSINAAVIERIVEMRVPSRKKMMLINRFPAMIHKHGRAPTNHCWLIRLVMIDHIHQYQSSRRR